MATNVPNLGQRTAGSSGSRAVIPQGQGVAQLSGGAAQGLQVPPGNRAIVKPGKVTVNALPAPKGGNGR